ncbi:MAG: hypothetical protein HYV08_14870 [Deltaproteobacteria bacterium]|nr:hypothetical protein [Deltaproteobacteria bacterium]
MPETVRRESVPPDWRWYLALAVPAVILLAGLAWWWLLPQTRVAREGPRPGADGTGPSFLRALALDPTTNTLFMGSPRGLLRSLDEGLTWIRMGIERPGVTAEILALAVHPRDPRRLYAGTERGLLVSGDGGRSWGRVGEGLEGMGVRLLALDPARPERLYAWTTSSRLVGSADSGRRWDLLGEGPASAPLALTVTLEPNASGGSREATPLAGTAAGLFRWRQSAAWMPTGAGLAAGPVQALGVDPSHPVRVYAAQGQRILRSETGGREWTVAGETPVPVTALAVRPGGAVLYAGAATGRVLRSVDSGARWTVQNP